MSPENARVLNQHVCHVVVALGILSLGICDKTLKNKLAGRTPFTWPEIKEIQQQFFPDMQMEVLFKTNTDVGEELEE